MATDTKTAQEARLEDLKLAAEASGGDQACRRKLANRLMDRVRSTAWYLAASDPDVEDYAQLAMIEILDSAGTYRGESRLEKWAERITVRTVMRKINQKRWRSRFLIFDSEQSNGHAQGSSAEDDISARHVRQRMAILVSRLKPNHRLAITLKMMMGYSVDEIAEITGANPHTVDYRLRKGREHLRNLILKDRFLREHLRGKDFEQ